MSGLVPPLLLVLASALVGCGPGPGGSNSPQESERRPSENLRIVSLAPHLAELVFAVGAGDLLVGVTSFTDFPEGAAALPKVGDAFSLDQERLAVLRPDLLLAWKSGTAVHVIDELEQRGYRVESIETRGVEDIARALEQIGRLTGRQSQATEAAAAFRRGIRELEERYREADAISVFYQVSGRPLYTVNGDHYVSELIGICGGSNIFGDLSRLAPLVDVESVLARDPEAMLASDDSQPDAFAVWRRWPYLAANRYGNYFFLPANQVGRATPRLLHAGEALCEALDTARRNRSAV
jgi:iron complex transport system substrate-binding protein